MPVGQIIGALGSIAGGLISAAGQANASDTAAKAHLSAAKIAGAGYQAAGAESAAAARKAAGISATGYQRAGAAQQAGAATALGTELTAEQQSLAAEQAGAASATAGFQPYLSTGAGATYSLAELYGLPTPSNPQGGEPLSNEALQSFQNSPDYQFALQQGIKAANASAAAKGGALSGGAALDVEQFGSGLASEQYGNYFNRLLQLSGMGQSAAGSVGNVYEQLAGQQAGTITNAGSQIATTELASSDAAARAILGASGARAGGITSAAGAEAVGLTGASSAYANAIQQAANINAAGTAGQYADISSGVTSAFNNASFENYLAGNGPGSSAYATPVAATPTAVR